MTQHLFDWLVIGAGSAGLSVARQASKAGHSVCVIDCSISPDYSSVRNQGWLHSGGLFCFYREGRSDVAQECQIARMLIEEVQSDSGMQIISKTPGIAMFDGFGDAQRWIDRSEQNGITSRLLSETECVSLFNKFGKSEFHNFAVELQDCAVDNAAFLNALVALCLSSGVVFKAEPRLAKLAKLQKDEAKDAWTLSVADTVYSSRNVVVCLGVLGPSFLDRTLSIRIDHKITNAIVMAIEGLDIERLIISPNQMTKNLNLSPCSNGFTVNCGLLDQMASVIEGESIDPSRITETIEHLLYNWPVIAQSQPKYSTYSCQKLEITGLSIEEKRRFVIRSLASGLFFYYPGKFTTALVGARELVGSTQSIVRRAAPPSENLGQASTFAAFNYLHPGARLPADRQLGS